MTATVKTEFEKRYGQQCRIYASPGRINLIGDHTDYNLGFVLPAAIDKAIYVAIKPNDSNTVNAFSVDYNAEATFNIDGPQPKELWASFIYGITRELQKAGLAVKGYDCVFAGDVPLGAGLSSSAALECAFGFALNDIYGGSLERRELAKAGQMTEHNYIGVKCGIMDQFASLFGKAGHAIKLDCRSLDFDLMPFDPQGYEVVLIDSMVKHSLASSEYNVRRAQCEEAVKVIASHEPGVESPRDVTRQMLAKYESEIEPVAFRRCSFVLGENERLLTACDALKEGDYETFGNMMYGSHEGLSKDYEVSCEELDYIVGIAKNHDEVLGARMMGGGFGGCVISLVKKDCHEKYIRDVKEKFTAKFGVEPRIIDIVIGEGSRRLE